MSDVEESDDTVVEPEADDRDALIAAADEALKDAPAEEAKSDGRDEKGRFLKPTDLAKPKVEEKPSTAIARELARREARREEETSYKSKMAEAEQVLSRARAVADEMAEERAAIKREREEVEAFKATVRRDPMAAMKEVGWTAEQFITNAERARDPNYQEILETRSELSKRDALIEKLTARLDDYDARGKKYEEQTKAQQAQAEVSEFWTSIPEDSPLWANERYEDRDDIIAHARKVRQQYYDKTGKVASPKEVGEYLHYLALQRKVAPAQTAGRKPGQAGQTKAKVSRAIGSSDSSERRGGNGKHIHDMTPEEEREYLMDVAKSAVSDSAD